MSGWGGGDRAPRTVRGNGSGSRRMGEAAGTRVLGSKETAVKREPRSPEALPLLGGNCPSGLPQGPQQVGQWVSSHLCSGAGWGVRGGGQAQGDSLIHQPLVLGCFKRTSSHRPDSPAQAHLQATKRPRPPSTHPGSPGMSAKTAIRH